MSFEIVYGDREFWVPLNFDCESEERLLRLMEVASQSKQDQAQLSIRLADAITVGLESSTTRPSDKQVKYALEIARTLSLTLTPEVLQSREQMTGFLSQYANAYRRRKHST